MKKLSLIFIIVFISLLCGCTSNDSPDIFELIQAINVNEEININPELLIVRENQDTEYTYLFNNNLCFKAYADESGKIIYCTITDVKNDKLTSKLIKSICSSYGWNFNKMSNPVADYYIIYNDSFNFNTTTLPELKSNIVAD